MKRTIRLILLFSIIGVVISGLLVYLHYAYPSVAELAFCGSPNLCFSLSLSKTLVFAGIPFSVFRLFLYGLVLMTCIVVLPKAGDAGRFPHVLSLCVFAVLSAADLAALGVVIRWGDLSILNLLPVPVDLAGTVCLAVTLRRAPTRRTGVHKRDGARLSFFLMYGITAGLLLFSVLSINYRGKTGSSLNAPSEEEIAGFVDFFDSMDTVELELPSTPLSLGSERAPMIIAVFTEFLCPACYQLYKDERYLLDRFRGRIRIDHYVFPQDKLCNPDLYRTVYQNACLLTRAFLGASRIGEYRSFLTYHYAHFDENRTPLTTGDVMPSIDGFLDEREDIDKKSFMELIDSEEVSRILEEHVQASAKLKIDATPTLFIGGKRFSGLPHPAYLEAVIERELRTGTEPPD